MFFYRTIRITILRLFRLICVAGLDHKYKAKPSQVVSLVVAAKEEVGPKLVAASSIKSRGSLWISWKLKY